MVIIAHPLLGIDGCPHHLSQVARTYALQLGYALFVFSDRPGDPSLQLGAPHVVDWKRFLSVLLNTPESSSDLCFPSLLLSRAVSATKPQHSSYPESVT